MDAGRMTHNASNKLLEDAGKNPRIRPNAATHEHPVPGLLARLHV